MLKVLLVDDEMLVRLGIKSCINFDKLGLKLIGEASNGQEALEIVEKELPDVILLDIRMPVMDGLQFINMINQKRIQTNIIVLSCYNDFEYVKEALKLGAKDYILKLSFKPDDLCELLTKITHSIYKSDKDSKNNNDLNQQESIEYLRNLIFTLNYQEQIPIILEKQLNSLQYIIAKLVYKSDFIESTDRALINIIKEITKEYGLPLIVREKNELVLFLGLDVRYTASDIKEMAERILNTIKGCLNKEVKISFSSIFNNISCSKKAYADACTACEYLFYSRDDKFVLYENHYTTLESKLTITKEMEQSIYDSLEVCDAKEILHIINAFFDEIIASKSAKQQAVINTSLTIISILSKFQRDNNLLIDDMHINSYDYIVASDNIFQLKDWFNIFIEKYVSFIAEKQIALKRKDLKAAEEYIKINYKRRINLSEISKHVNMSENYFSYLFKKEYHDTFINFQNKIKILKAKELLSTKDYKINELSEELGFTDQSYFCKVFKKIMGVSPEQFKMSLSKHR